MKAVALAGACRLIHESLSTLTAMRHARQATPLSTIPPTHCYDRGSVQNRDMLRRLVQVRDSLYSQGSSRAPSTPPRDKYMYCFVPQNR